MSQLPVDFATLKTRKVLADYFDDLANSGNASALQELDEKHVALVEIAAHMRLPESPWGVVGTNNRDCLPLIAQMGPITQENFFRGLARTLREMCGDWPVDS